MAEKLIVIVGITGNQGASVADVFINEPGWKIRGITRDPSKPSSNVWSDKGVEIVAGDLNNAESLTSAFKGANAIFGVTDFWQPFFTPANQERAKKEGKTINEVCYDIELQQGKNIIDAAAGAIDTLDRFVLSTLSDAKKWSNGNIKWNLHFDGKAAQVDYLKETYPDLWKKTSLIQLGIFMTNWQSGGFMAPQKQEDGSYKLSMPMKGDRKIPMIQPRWDTGSFVKALVEVEPGKNLLAFGSFISQAEWCALWGKKYGVTCTFEHLPDGVMPNAIPGGMGLELEDMFKYFSDYGYDGSDPSVVMPKVLGVPVKYTTFEQYLEKEDFSKVLSA